MSKHDVEDANSQFSCFVCYRCGEVFSTVTEMELHEQAEHLLEPNCPIKKSKSVTNESTPCNASASSCPTCGVVFASVKQCTIHIVRGHLVSNEHCNKDTNPVFGSVSEGTSQALNINEESSSNSFPSLTCKICEMKFQDRIELFDHVANKHNKRVVYECNICGDIFTNRLTLTKHVQQHNENKDQLASFYFCPYCAKEFLYERCLRLHVATHTGETPFSCNFCQEEFRSHGELSLHKSIHTGKGAYVCRVCSKKFPYKCYLNRHLRAHASGPMPCEYCGKVFNVSSVLVNHVRQDHSDKLYHCSICGKAFTYPCYLERHKVVHCSSSKYNCTLCEKRFTNRGTLLSHLNQHFPGVDVVQRLDKTHKCPFCEQKYAYESSLERHLSLEHPDLCPPLPKELASALFELSSM